MSQIIALEMSCLSVINGHNNRCLQQLAEHFVSMNTLEYRSALKLIFLLLK